MERGTQINTSTNTTKEEKMTEQPATMSKAQWADRLTLVLPMSQYRKLMKGKRCQVMKQKRWYEIVPEKASFAYDENGKKMSKAALKRVIRTM